MNIFIGGTSCGGLGGGSRAWLFQRDIGGRMGDYKFYSVIFMLFLSGFHSLLCAIFCFVCYSLIIDQWNASAVCLSIDFIHIVMSTVFYRSLYYSE